MASEPACHTPGRARRHRRGCFVDNPNAWRLIGKRGWAHGGCTAGERRFVTNAKSYLYRPNPSFSRVGQPKLDNSFPGIGTSFRGSARRRHPSCDGVGRVAGRPIEEAPRGPLQHRKSPGILWPQHRRGSPTRGRSHGFRRLGRPGDGRRRRCAAGTILPCMAYSCRSPSLSR